MGLPHRDLTVDRPLDANRFGRYRENAVLYLAIENVIGPWAAIDSVAHAAQILALAVALQLLIGRSERDLDLPVPAQVIAGNKQRPAGRLVGLCIGLGVRRTNAKTR